MSGGGAIKFRLAVNDEVEEVEADEQSVRVGSRHGRPAVRKGPRGYTVSVGRRRFQIRPSSGGASINGIWRRIATSDIEAATGAVAARLEGRRLEVRPPMPGHVVRILVRPDERVLRGQPLVVLEAMKMQNEIAAPAAGVVESVRVHEGDSVTPHDLLAILRTS